MAYIGREPQVGNFQVCDAISVVNGQAAYTMQVSSVNVSPETANHMLVSLNGVLQAPGSSYTVSGSTITFASNLVTGDVINFIQILGSTLDLGVPSDSTVSLAKLTATGTKNSTTFLRGDNTFAAAGGGKLLQVVSAVATAATETSSTTFVATNSTVDITPSATSSKIFVIAHGIIDSKANGNQAYATLYRDSTNLAGGTASFSQAYGASSRVIAGNSLTFLDSPSSTSELTYAVYVKTASNTGIWKASSSSATITVMEIGA